MQDGDASIPRDRGILTQGGFAELGKEKITLLDARGRSKSSSMYTGQSQMARVVKGASRVEEKFGKKKENRGRTRQWQPPTLPPRIRRVREGE